MENIRFALTGNPNSGKTSIFNEITGANQRVGNWGGVTVDIKSGHIRRSGRRLEFTDIPGTYSLSAYTLEEIVARDFIIEEDVDAVINVVDSTNLERNLYLGVQLLELGKPLIFAFNMYDELSKSGVRVDIEQLSRLLGVPICFTVGRTGKGIAELVDSAVELTENEGGSSPPVHINYGKEIEEVVSRLVELLTEGGFDFKKIQPRWYAVKLLEEDEEVEKKVRSLPGAEPIFNERDAAVRHIQEIYQEDMSTLISEKRYGFILGALGETVHRPAVDRVDLSEKIDNIMTDRFLAYPIFALFMWLLFQATFSLGEYPMGWIEQGIAALSSGITSVMAPSPLRSLIVDGILGGVGGVLVFLPNILILFFGISILEDTGYMARIAFIMDKLMHRIGLHGKSFIPLIMGVGCSVPAIMAARTLESNRDRVLTILIAPLITCSARLPVYILFAGTFFPEHAGNVIFLLYFFSFFFAFAMGFIFRKTLFRGEGHPFVMELPPYRIPTAKSALIHMWEKAKHYLQKMGGVVLVFSIIIWFLSNYPATPRLDTAHHEEVERIERIIEEAGSTAEMEQREILLDRENRDYHRKMMSRTYIGRMGRLIEPAIAPLGFDWRMGVSLITGFVAKEVVVSTLGVLFTVGEEADEESSELQEALTRAYSPLTGLAFLFFVMLYTPCIVALVTLIREIQSWKWSVFSVAYQVLLAWLAAFVVRWGGILLGFG